MNRVSESDYFSYIPIVVVTQLHTDVIMVIVRKYDCILIAKELFSSRSYCLLCQKGRGAKSIAGLHHNWYDTVFQFFIKEFVLHYSDDPKYGEDSSWQYISGVCLNA